jgi:broad specificity phosphatase PhoE
LTTFYLMRHGQADFSLADERRLQGAVRELVPLTSLGRQQVRAATEALRALQPECILASPITRSLQSAAMLSRALDLSLNVEFDLHEWVPDLTFTYDLEEVSHEAFREMQALGGEWPPGEKRNWEPRSSVRRRVGAVLERYLQHERALVVCHSVVVIAMGGPALEPAEFWEYRYQTPGSKR